MRDLMKSVSLIIPTYNRAYCLSEAIDSALGQTRQPEEIIVIDDASTDNTDQVLARYADRIRILRNQTNQGASRSRNLAVEASRGDYIAFLDSDDAFLPDKLALQMAVAEKHPDAGMIGTDYWMVDQQGRVLFHPGGETPSDPCEALLFSVWSMLGAILIKREAFTSAGGFNEEIIVAEDHELWSRIAIKGYPFVFVNKPLLWYRMQTQSLNLLHNAQIFKYQMMVIENITQSVPRIAIKTDLVNEAKALCHIRAAISCGFRSEWERCDTHLDDAFALKPEWVNDTSELQDALINQIANPFIPNPVNGSVQFLQHISQSRGDLSLNAEEMLARVYIHFGLLNSAIGEADEGRSQLNQAKRLDPDVFEARSTELVPSMLWFIDEMEFAEAQKRLESMLAAIPASEQVRRTLASKAFSDHHLRNAFRQYERQDYRHVFDDAVHAIKNRPQLLRNRGVLSILGRATVHNIASLLPGHGN